MLKMISTGYWYHIILVSYSTVALQYSSVVITFSPFALLLLPPLPASKPRRGVHRRAGDVVPQQQ